MSGELATALAALQADLPAISKGETATVPTKTGGSFTYDYAALPEITDALMPALAKHGLSFIAKPTMHEGQFVLSYSLLHESGEREDGHYPLSGGTPQARGSEITYARRYCLCAVTGVAPESDDDGATAEREATTRPAPTPTAARSNKQSSGQQKMLHALFKERGIETHEHRVNFCSTVLGHDVENTSDMTYQETSRVIDVLKAGPPAQQQADPPDNPGFGGEQS